MQLLCKQQNMELEQGSTELSKLPISATMCMKINRHVFGVRSASGLPQPFWLSSDLVTDVYFFLCKESSCEDICVCVCWERSSESWLAGVKKYNFKLSHVLSVRKMGLGKSSVCYKKYLTFYIFLYSTSICRDLFSLLNIGVKKSSNTSSVSEKQ